MKYLLLFIFLIFCYKAVICSSISPKITCLNGTSLKELYNDIKNLKTPLINKIHDHISKICENSKLLTCPLLEDSKNVTYVVEVQIDGYFDFKFEISITLGAGILGTFAGYLLNCLWCKKAAKNNEVEKLFSSKVFNDEDGFKYRVDVRGFKNNEIQVDLEGEDIVIQAKHKEENENEYFERLFLRRLKLPKDVQKDAIKCDLDESDCLVISAPKVSAIEDPEKISNSGFKSRPIPIKFKKNNKNGETKQVLS